MTTIRLHLKRLRIRWSLALARFRVSAFGKAMAAGLTIFTAAAMGSIAAEQMGSHLASKLVLLLGASPDAGETSARIAGIIAAFASGITATPKAISVTARKATLVRRLEGDLAGSFRAAVNAARGATLTGIVAFLIGGTFGALPVRRISVVVGVAAGLASCVGAYITTVLSATMDFLYRTTRARARVTLRQGGSP